MNIAIRSYLAASYLLESEPNKWSTIVILDSGLTTTSFVSEHSCRHLYLTFDDVSNADAGKRVVHHSQLKEAIDFSDDTKQLLVCCRAGQSRSAATAFVIAYNYCGKSMALSLLNPTRHVPNKLVVQIGANVVEKQEIVADFEEWQRDNRLVRLADYYDEIEAEVDVLEQRGARNRIIA